MSIEKTNQPLDGVKCVVNTCHYYVYGDHCSAAKIEIQPRNATSTEETDCATFRPDNGSMQ
ncbi:conserved hypothetical protein [[Clostridium] ultunense Esp]|uniref:DUF1540 domain-containing protein n=1 Tax=[Clostridium] ultunense Esp TaxID=1288971 RepID=M1ZI28_9FIRM|nr:DUF1540 domain-containing protein [Schnuerera ultunensis]CCQ98601.1 conserved hypothetical protein [[Clostridium] ultunense Esp]SHD77780.1 conserved protein of unknown function [[Clostridium] ultunense Esp]